MDQPKPNNNQTNNQLPILLNSSQQQPPKSSSSIQNQYYPSSHHQSHQKKSENQQRLQIKLEKQAQNNNQQMVSEDGQQARGNGNDHNNGDDCKDQEQIGDQGEDDCKEQNEGKEQNERQQPSGSLTLAKKRTHRKSDISTFIMKTYKILDQKRNADIVQWADEGNCFIVKDKDRFQNQILPKYFKHRKFSSFVRQLNMYDFHKIRKQKEIPIFRHKYFKQGMMDLLHKIKRKSGQQMRQEQGSLLGNPNPTNPNIPSQVQLPNNDPSHSFHHSNSHRHLHPKSSQHLPFPPSNTPLNNPHYHHHSRNNSIQSEIDILTHQNAQLQHHIAQISHQINHLEMSKDRKKEKLMKIISAMMFFELKVTGKSKGRQAWAEQNGSEGNERSSQDKEQAEEIAKEERYNLRRLQNHFIKDQEPWSFTEYSEHLSHIYQYIKNSIV